MSSARVPVFALLTANTLSFIAEAIAIVAIPWFVFELTGSAAKVGLIGFFTVLPRVLAIFFGGQVVDRVGFRTSSVVSDLLSGLSVCGIPLLYMSGNLTFPLLIVLVILGAVFDGPGATAKESMVPDLASMAKIDLDRINAFFQGSRRLSGFIGPVVAGFLVAAVGASNVLWVNAVVFGLSAVLVLSIVPRVATSPGDEGGIGSFWASTTFGFRFLREHRLLLWLAGFLSLTNFLEAPLVTIQIPALVREYYGSVDRVGMLIGAHGVGALVGTVIFSMIAPRLPRRTTFITSFLLASPLGLVFAMVPPWPVAIGAAAVLGMFAGPLNPILMSIRQERVPARYRARVFGTMVTLAFIAIPLGQLAGGFAVEWLGVRVVFALVSTIYIAVVLSMFLTPVLREMDHRPPLAVTDAAENPEPAS